MAQVEVQPTRDPGPVLNGEPVDRKAQIAWWRAQIDSGRYDGWTEQLLRERIAEAERG
jgi:hypothetical protein